jgi:Cof subfamily protein (haloacid dehalogenase superfamily)
MSDRLHGRLLIALDIDGTVLTETGELRADVAAEVTRVAAAGHEVMLATGRSVAATLPVLERLGITPTYVVCSNGAVTLKRDETASVGYVRERVETFIPGEVLTTIRQYLGDVNYAVEDPDGVFRYVGSFPEGTLGEIIQEVTFEDLLTEPATRVVVISPNHELEEFLRLVAQMGLHQVSYNVGWAAWLDIAPQGVNKATALERIRTLFDIPVENLIAIGDGRNDIEMLQWAGASGRGVAMAQAPEEVLAVASEVTTSDLQSGVAKVLSSL